MNEKDIDRRSCLYEVAAFYFFTFLSNEQLVSLKKELNSISSEKNILGTIIIASEGVNGTICGSSDDISSLRKILQNYVAPDQIEFKYSYVNRQAFRRFKVKHKVEIVTMGLSEIDPNKEVGKYIEPLDWNKFISDPGTILIDTRNKYEVGIGSFKGALNPDTNNFREFPLWVEEKLGPLVEKDPQKKIAMFCTGGIRCEKATSLLVRSGFSEVHHLHGGILRYLEVVPEEESLWEGECFVFDQRVSLNHQLHPGNHLLCYACGMPLNQKERKELTYIKGVQCLYCKDSFTDKDRIRFAERQKHYDNLIV